MADLSKVLEQLYGSTGQTGSAGKEAGDEVPVGPEPVEARHAERFSRPEAPAWASDERLDAAFSRWNGDAADKPEGATQAARNGRGTARPAATEPALESGQEVLASIESADPRSTVDEAEMITAPVPLLVLDDAPWQRSDDDILPANGTRRQRAGRRFEGAKLSASVPRSPGKRGIGRRSR
ncbi:MAG: hypothetical protein M0Z87_03960 [Actinomycetota bacterium]|nr:hypothetical protein [Actinomycetota bacterium]